MTTPDSIEIANPSEPSEAELFLRELAPQDQGTRRRAFLQLLRQLVGDNAGGAR